MNNEQPEDDLDRCPICGERKVCGRHSQEGAECWCMSETFPPGIFELVPEELRGKACICRNCLKTYQAGLAMK
ncbi:cysteine-rich CWC family protein [Paenibacillus sp. HN-1]|uniref:cysteine-rich CWC family protein n=1 Tax=Paenibacillus TaxID=44249 RepID=UPI001CA99829|nr:MULTISPECIES: cysteine-rich CWC family protein [Paenibacillus]MBY9081767.1 cysteine-rich CWC family protein [Paenibacillus sp. CGMCC 1.18879]MBY9083636.1 cysteine-rich CWC family protein [Paenibacillus sinensis]